MQNETVKVMSELLSIRINSKLTILMIDDLIVRRVRREDMRLRFDSCDVTELV